MNESPSSSRALRWLPWFALLALLVVRLCHEWFGPDIWYHLALGERIAREGRAQPADNLILQQAGFINVYWLFQLLVRGIFTVSGLIGVSALFLACWLATFAIWLATTGAMRAAPWGFAVAFGAALVCQTRFEERPEVFSFLFLTLQIHALTNWDLAAAPRRAALVFFTIVQILWSNVHGYFVLGPLLVAAKLLSVAIGTPRAEWPRARPAWRGLWLLAGLTGGATLVSPFGLRNGAGVITLWKFFGEMRLEVQEFQPAIGALLSLWTVKLFWLGWATTLFAALFVLYRTPRREAFSLVLAVAGLWLSATSFRNIPLLVFFAAPLTRAILSKRDAFRRLEHAVPLALGAVAFGLASVAIAGTFGPSRFGIRVSPAASPVQATEYLRTTGFHGAIFNDPADGGYLEFHLPRLRLYGDSRYVEPAPVREYFAALCDPAAFRRLDERHTFDAALFKITVSRPVLVSLANDPLWRLAYADLHRAFFVRRSPTFSTIMPGGPTTIYHGEDLTIRAHGAAALQWSGFFAEANQPDLLLQFLHSLSAASHVPAPVIEVALRYGLATHHAGILAVARTLRPKMIAARPSDLATIDRLLTQAAAP